MASFDGILVTQNFLLACAAVGMLYLGNLTASFMYVVYKTMLRGGKNLKKSYGEWAVVTGATDGIGKAMAFEFAKKGMNVLLIARSAEKLAAVKSELAAKYTNVQVKTEVIDFGSFGAKDTARVTQVLAALEVGVLVNNVGISYAFPQWLHELTEEEVQGLMTVNIESVVWMTRAVLPQMISRKKGAVVNMSSASARPPAPMLTVYASTKGFVENFTKGLAIEYAGKGVHFQCQSPLFVATAITFPGSKVPVEKRATLSTPTAAKYAKYAVARIGYDTMVSPYWAHEMYMWVSERLPDKLIGWAVMKMHVGLRFHKKNVAKMEEKALAAKKGK